MSMAAGVGYSAHTDTPRAGAEAAHTTLVDARSIDVEYVGRRCEELLGRLDGKPIFALYIDCAGRAAAYCGSEREPRAIGRPHWQGHSDHSHCRSS